MSGTGVSSKPNCLGCGGGGAPHDINNPHHSLNMQKLIQPLTEQEKFFAHLNNGEVGLEPYYYKDLNGVHSRGGFRLVIIQKEGNEK